MNFKLTKKQERIAIIGLLALIICSVGYQWAYGTNESSYKYGYGQGKSEWVNCTDFDADCGAAPDDCQPTVYVSTNDQFNGIPVNPASVDVKNVTYYNLHYYIEKKKVMTNKTACMDGYSHAWENSCKHNGTACVVLFKDYGFLPDGGVLRNVNGTWYRCDAARTNKGMFARTG